MKIALPIANGTLSPHFGHCDEFVFVEVALESKTITGIEHLTAPEHEPGILPRWLHEQGATVIIACGMGQRAQALFNQYGITVVIGAPAENPETLVRSYLEGTLQTGDNICDH